MDVPFSSKPNISHVLNCSSSLPDDSNFGIISSSPPNIPLPSTPRKLENPKYYQQWQKDSIMSQSMPEIRRQIVEKFAIVNLSTENVLIPNIIIWSKILKEEKKDNDKSCTTWLFLNAKKWIYHYTLEELMWNDILKQTRWNIQDNIWAIGNKGTEIKYTPDGPLLKNMNKDVLLQLQIIQFNPVIYHFSQSKRRKKRRHFHSTIEN